MTLKSYLLSFDWPDVLELNLPKMSMLMAIAYGQTPEGRRQLWFHDQLMRLSAYYNEPYESLKAEFQQELRTSIQSPEECLHRLTDRVRVRNLT